MSTNIYNIDSKKGKSSEFYKDDEDYQSFIAAVQSNSLTDLAKQIPERSLYALWFVSKGFRLNWLSPERESDAHILFTAFVRGWSQAEAKCLIAAWWTLHKVKGSREKYQMFQKLVFTRQWEKAQPIRQQYEARLREIKMDKEKGKLKARILETLAVEPSTSAILAKKLGAKHSAVQSQIFRMAKEIDAKGNARVPEITWMGWGLYKLTAVVVEAVLQPTIAVVDVVVEAPKPTQPIGTFNMDWSVNPKLNSDGSLKVAQGWS